MSLKINQNKVHSFLKDLNGAEQTYLNHIVNISASMRDVVRKYNLSPERFCKEMAINKRQFNAYMSGQRRYDLKDIAKLTALTYTLITENLSDHDVVKIGKG